MYIDFLREMMDIKNRLKESSVSPDLLKKYQTLKFYHVDNCLKCGGELEFVKKKDRKGRKIVEFVCCIGCGTEIELTNASIN
jgi:hypothetical protein